MVSWGLLIARGYCRVQREVGLQETLVTPLLTIGLLFDICLICMTGTNLVPFL